VVVCTNVDSRADTALDSGQKVVYEVRTSVVTSPMVQDSVSEHDVIV
jgi:hypothetical protein